MPYLIDPPNPWGPLEVWQGHAIKEARDHIAEASERPAPKT